MISKNEYDLIIRILNKSLENRVKKGFVEDPHYQCGFYNGVEWALSCLEMRAANFRTIQNEELA